MENLTQSLAKALENRNWHGALFIGLALPDICGKIDCPKERSQKRYESWFKKYIEPKYTIMQWDEKCVKQKIALPSDIPKVPFTFLSGADCYALRCAFLHEGSEDISGQRAQERIRAFHFRAPKLLPDGSRGGDVHCNKNSAGILQLQVDLFCQDILNGIDEWIEVAKPNIPPLLQVFDGLSRDGPPIF